MSPLFVHSNPPGHCNAFRHLVIQLLRHSRPLFPSPSRNASMCSIRPYNPIFCHRYPLPASFPSLLPACTHHTLSCVIGTANLDISSSCRLLHRCSIPVTLYHHPDRNNGKASRPSGRAVATLIASSTCTSIASCLPCQSSRLSGRTHYIKCCNCSFYFNFL